MKIIGIIPARYASTRFPGKPLALIAGKPLIQHVVQRCQQAKTLSEVIVATDDERIRHLAETFCRVEMTAAHHPSGSDRIAEVAARCACDAAERLEQLRALENGIPIAVVTVDYDSVGVDVKADVERVEAILKGRSTPNS